MLGKMILYENFYSSSTKGFKPMCAYTTVYMVNA